MPVHTPEWTQLGESDPGVTLVELFAFLTESLLYRANRVPEVQPAQVPAPARRAAGDRHAGARPRRLLARRGDRAQRHASRRDAKCAPATCAFRTAGAIDVLPVEAHAYVKFSVDHSETDRAYYTMLYQAAARAVGAKLEMYRTRALDTRQSIDLGKDTADGVLWIALLIGQGRRPRRGPSRAWRAHAQPGAGAVCRRRPAHALDPGSGRQRR